MKATIVFGLAALAWGITPPTYSAQDTAQQLVQVLKNPGTAVGVRCEAAKSLAKLGSKARPVIPALAAVLKNAGTPEAVRKEAARALGKIGTRPSADALVEVLANVGTAKAIRIAAIEAVGGMGREGQVAVKELTRLSRNAGTDQDVRKAALAAIAAIEAADDRK